MQRAHDLLERRPPWRTRLAAGVVVAAAIALLATSCLSSTPLEDLGGTLTRAFAVNNEGVIVGRGIDDAGEQFGFVFDPSTGIMSAVPPLNGGTTEALDVNDHGLIVGNSFARDFICPLPDCPFPINHAFAYDRTTGQLDDLFDFGVGLPPANEAELGSTATGVNEAGEVVGAATTVTGPSGPGPAFEVHARAFMFDTSSHAITDLGAYGMTDAADIDEHGRVAGTIAGRAAVVDASTGIVTDLGTLGGTSSYATAISDDGLVVGAAQVTGNSAYHAFVYDLVTGVLTDIGTLPAPGAPQSIAYGVNDNRIVVGLSSASGEIHPFAYDVPTKTLRDLGVLGTSDLLEGRDINDAGLTVGFSQVTPAHAWRATVSRHY
jgi:probable HAF family extracellular repeat protein